ncbi:MAG TPA: hypothetical protein VHM90_19530 [Phycisphaerae bacterium]|jgi:hypothetical protein|nr:hypothetical protein [Phycisphaerae bacterium]
MKTRSETSVWASQTDENYSRFLTRLSPKALAVVEKHAELREADSAQGYGRTWRHMAGVLAQMAPAAIEAMGTHALKFHIPDGKYRLQVFALADQGKNEVDIYLPNVLAEAVTRKVLCKAEADGHTHRISGEESTIQAMVITADDKECPPYCKAMLGWGRKALKATLPANADARQLRAVERLCELAAESFPAPVAAVVAVPKAG